MKPEKDYRKSCTLCERPRDVLVRCQIDETRRWHFVCPGSCWKHVSGGVIDGDDEHKLYRYGGMWKNKHEAVSAKKSKRAGKVLEESEGCVALGGGGREQQSGDDGTGDMNTTHDGILASKES